MDATLCREHLARLIGEETGLLDQLADLLDKEHRSLNDSDVDALEHTTQARQHCMSDLVRIEDERRSLCRMSGQSADLKGLEALLKWCDPKGSLATHWSECANRAKRCRELNDRNGMVVAARLKRVQGMLNVITGQPQSPTTYGPQGAYNTAPTGRMVRGEA